MILRELHTFIKVKGKVSLRQLAKHFAMSPAALEPMLDFWVKKGRIVLSEQRGCHACSAVCASHTKLYCYSQNT